MQAARARDAEAREDSPSRTEFPPYCAAPAPTPLSAFFSKLLSLPGVFSQPEGEPVRSGIPDPSRQESEAEVPPEDDAVGPGEGRSLNSVLRRISSLVAPGAGAGVSSGGARYADTDLARYWMPDDISRECYECEAKFSTLRRRHHCRVCGQIFCSRCCSQRVPGQICGCAGGLRVCTYCCKVVLSYLQENDEISSDLRTLQENLQVKFPEKTSSSQLKIRDNFMLAREQNEQTEVRTSTKESLQDVFRHLAYALPTQQHRYRLVRYNGVWRGCDILQWVTENTHNTTRTQATEVCQRLVSEGYMECVTEQPKFADYALYRPAQLDDIHSTDVSASSEPARLADSVSSFCLDLNLGESSARLLKTPKNDEKKSPSSDGDGGYPLHSAEEGGCEEGGGGERGACAGAPLAEAGREHLRLLARQCLAREGLPAAWLDVLLLVCQQAADAVAPDMYSSDIDVRHYVQVKKVAGGGREQSRVVPGVVLSKNVAHRAMPQRLDSPRVLLLDCSIAYQRAEGKLTSLEPVLLQEHEYLVRSAARILALQPSAVLVRGSAARTVQDELRRAGVALATGVRERTMRRAARCLRADVVTSIDSRIGMPRLGSCATFYIKTFESKTLMVFEGCAEPQLGCCILLRGPSASELVRVKRVAKFLLLACYNWRLERAFLTDICAALPDANMSFVDTRERTPEVEQEDEETHVTEEHTDRTTQRNKEDAREPMAVSMCSEALEDPLQSGKCGPAARKTESDKTVSCGVPVGDFSDPLRARQVSVEDEVFLPPDDTKLTTHSDEARWCTDDAVLSMSPHVKIGSPYLETEAGRKCELRAYFHTPLFPPDARAGAGSSSAPAALTPRAARRRPSRPQHSPDNADAIFKETHLFVHSALTRSVEDPSVRAALAHYRAVGGRLAASTHRVDCPQYRRSVVKLAAGSPAAAGGAGADPETDRCGAEAREAEARRELDPLAPENHQRLALLIYSFSSKSPNVPDFCINPWIVEMEMYGRHDISLGAFLDKYCFNTEYRCPSRSCAAPMLHHVRRFVHGDGCITITCNTIGNSTSLDKVPDEQSKQITWWSRCGRCAGAATRTERLSRTALSLSLAKYMELRLRAPRYTRAAPAACAHSLNHAHAHYFAKGLTTACFRYNKIKTWDICLPPAVISTHYDTAAVRDALVHQVNELLLKGHEAFSSLSAGEAEHEHAAFKQHMEQIHLALTSQALHQRGTPAGVVKGLWSVSDQIITGEKMMRDAQDRWTAPASAPAPAPAAKQAKALQENSVEEKSDAEESPYDSNSQDSAETTSRGETAEQTGACAGAEEDEERGDRKTVRAILSQLLSNSQPANQGGMIIAGGVVPVVVFAGEIGSVIAAGLASVQYQQQLNVLLAHHIAAHSNMSEAEESDMSSPAPAAPPAPSPAGKDKSDADAKTKSSRSNEHIEVLLKDGLLCRVYYAAQFQRLRAQLLAGLGDNGSIADTLATDRANGENAADGGGGSGGADSDNRDGGARTPSQGHKKSRSDGGGGGSAGGGSAGSARVLSEAEEGFIRSLSRCVAWTARGGKSGSTFCKTRDDRFVLKEMSKQEWQQFLEFAPHYFQHVAGCHQGRLPTLLARIVGVYSVGGAGNGVLVMENLFYGRAGELQQRYDLKGASRNRLTADTAQPDAVLMDENMLNSRWERQLYVAAHTGAVLFAAIERDTGFLAQHSVMDYSLLLGVTHDHKLVPGIIDYIRTFTWDKKLEHLVKKNLGSGQPTIVSPLQYRERFLAAARKYFLHAPDTWHGLHRGLQHPPAAHPPPPS